MVVAAQVDDLHPTLGKDGVSTQVFLRRHQMLGGIEGRPVFMIFNNNNNLRHFRLDTNSSLLR
jgi:hypothetical protein